MDTGLHCLSALAMFHQLPVDNNQLKHQFAQPGKLFDTQDIIRAAKSLDLKAKSFHLHVDELTNNHLPAILKTHDGSLLC